MPIKTKVNCKVCQTILAQPKKWEGRLAKRIYGSRYYMPSSEYNLADIAREYADKFGYESLLNHCKKHQFLTEKDYNERHLRQVAAEAEKTIIKAAAEQAVTAQQVWQKILDKGMTELEAGKMQLTPTHLLAAARDKSNWEIKHAGQQMALMDMVFGFASGEKLPDGVKEDGNVIEGELADGTGGAVESREERSRAFYQSLAGDAATPRTD